MSMDDIYQSNQNMMDSDYSDEVIENIKALNSQDEISKYADSLIDIECLENIGQRDVYTQSIEEAEPFVENCIEIGKYLFENKLCSKETIAQYFKEAIEYMNCIDTTGYHYFSQNEGAYETLRDKAADTLLNIIKQDASYSELLEYDYKSIAKQNFTKVSRIIIKDRYSDDEVFENFSQFQHYINGIILEELYENNSVDFSLNVYLSLEDEKNAREEIELNLSQMYDFDHLNHSFIDNMLEYLSYLSESELEDIIEGCTYDKCQIDLSSYKKYELNLLKLNFLDKDIIDDFKILFSKGYEGHKRIFEKLDSTNAINLALETLLVSYKHDIKNLEYETQIAQLEYRDRNREDNKEIYINTARLENFLPEYVLNDEKIFIVYLKLKASILSKYYRSTSLIEQINMDNILGYTRDINKEPRRSIDEVVSIFDKFTAREHYYV